MVRSVILEILCEELLLSVEGDTFMKVTMLGHMNHILNLMVMDADTFFDNTMDLSPDVLDKTMNHLNLFENCSEEWEATLPNHQLKTIKLIDLYGTFIAVFEV